jgi:FMN phosphatase YigB (HAD superfamily)
VGAIAQTPDHIFAEIANPQIEVISFDVFDTLLVRPVLEPSDMFSLQDAFWHASGYDGGFTSVRKEAERRAKSRLKLADAKRSEPTLVAIYQELADLCSASGDIVENLLQCELNDERRWLSARNCIMPFYERAVASGKRLIVISDTYHTCDFVSSVLRENGFGGFEQLFVSSESGLTKAEGSLYPHVLQSLNLTGNRILHVGDNQRSDIDNAAKNGLRTVHVPAAVFRYFSNRRNAYHWSGFQEDLSLGARLLLGLTITTCCDSLVPQTGNRAKVFNGDPKLLGYGFVGPILYFSALHDPESTDHWTKSWIGSLRSIAKADAALQELWNAAQAFCGEASDLLKDIQIPQEEQSFLEAAFLSLPFASKSEDDRRILDVLPPLPDECISVQPGLTRRLEIDCLHHLIFQRAYVRLITSRQNYFRSVTSPLLRLYAKLMGIA